MTETDKIRIKVLNYSLRLEKLASVVLCFVLDIKDVNKSKSFGNTGSSISFNQKLNLLLDYDAIEADDKKILDFAMGIRNQFMHNLSVNTYQDAFDCLDGAERNLKKRYSELFQNEDNEINLEQCAEKIFTESFKILTSMKGGIENKITQTAQGEHSTRLVESFKSVSKEMFEEMISEVNLDEFDFTDKKILTDRIVKLFKDTLTQSIDRVIAKKS